MATENITVTAEMRGDLARTARRTARAADELADELDDVARSGAKAAAGMEAADKAAGRLSPQLRKTRKAVHDNNREMAKTNRIADAIANRFIKVAVAGAVLKGALMGLKIPFMLAGLAVVIPALSALTAALTALTGALGPVLGLLATMPGLLIGIGLAAGTGIAAFKGIGDAVSALKGGDPEAIAEAMKDLSPAARDFAREVHSVGHEMSEISKIAQEEMMPGVLEGFKSLRKQVPILNKIVKEMAHEMGHLAENAGKMVGSLEWQEDFLTLGRSGIRITISMSNAMTSLLNAFRHLAIAAIPLTEWMARAIGEWAEQMSRAAAAGRASGALEEFFEGTRRVTEGVVKGIADLSMALYNTMKIGADWGGEMGNRLGDLIAKWREWTESIEGQNAIAAWFERSKPVMDSFLALLGAVGRAMQTIAGGGGPTVAQRKQLAARGMAAPAPNMEHLNATQALMDRMRTEVLPEFMEMLDGLDVEAAIDAVISLMTAFIQFVDKFPFNPMIKVIDTIADLIIEVTKFMEEYPRFASAMAWILTANTILSAVLLAAKITGVMRLVKFIRWMSKTKVGAAALSKVLTGLKWVLAGVRVALGAMFGTIGLVIAILALLAAGIYHVYKNNETFRNAVDRTWQWIQKAAWVMVKAVLIVFQIWVDSWLGVVGAMINGAASAFGWVRGIGPKLRGAADKFNTFRDRTNAALDGIQKTVDIKINQHELDAQIKQANDKIAAFVKDDRELAIRYAVSGAGISTRGDGPGNIAAAGKAADRARAAAAGLPVRMTSGYRTPAHNRRVGGSPTSYHLDRTNPATDWVGPARILDEMARRLRAAGGYRELLWRVPGHYDHLHYAHTGGWVTPSWPTLPGLKSNERPGILEIGERVVAKAQARKGIGDGPGRPVASVRRSSAASSSSDYNITFEQGSVVVTNPQADIDVERAVARGIEKHMREREERAVYR